MLLLKIFKIYSISSINLKKLKVLYTSQFTPAACPLQK